MNPKTPFQRKGAEAKNRVAQRMPNKGELTCHLKDLPLRSSAPSAPLR